ncbi:ferredoxin reductase, FNR like superfamily protein [Psychroflexus gondwanensis ACAM 44]|jgi:ferredoxin-NADP reductase|uniref:Ferredoxin reductase, FNR like superfamily protein n=1 Tax=Psychroflexus gondwanensis ACAM 44 TaxID=1189619 RepID=N1WXZ5_9FLAO|nr:ferredoxin reductase FNR like superfamily protein [Psychroflexus gondwanensis]EMY81959.1 ferredoxin reductase, FNR like superfamily protein [Psychroflexus gondwanensis ACAM 44]
MNTLEIKTIEKITPDVLQIRTNKPEGLEFKPGQATELFIKKENWEEQGRPFTFTSLPDDSDLEFVIKTYTSHDGVTDKLLDLKVGDELLQNEIFGNIYFRGEGTFIAGGAGLTPLIAILRDRQRNGGNETNKLIFANKTSKDIILKDELREMLSDRFINILSDEKTEEFAYGHIDESFLKQHIINLNQKFYVCGPDPMIESVVSDLKALGVEDENIIIEG